MAAQPIHSKNLFTLVQIQPKVFLTFNGFRANNFSKASFVIRNISAVAVVYRVVQQQGDTLPLKVRPQCNLIGAGCVQRVQIINDSELKPTLDHSVLVEVAVYEDTSRWTGREGLDAGLVFGDFYRFLCTFSDQPHLKQFQEQLEQLEGKLVVLERNAFRFVDGEGGGGKTWLPVVLLQIGLLTSQLVQLMPVAGICRHLSRSFFKFVRLID